jgi:hypothetical protein
MLLFRPRIVRFVVSLFLLVPASRATAGTLTPNPANGTSPATAGWDSVSLLPNPASYQSQCSWLYAAATNSTVTPQTPTPEPYYTPTTQWNFTYNAGFNGTFALTQYAATIQGPANAATFGGANFSITYTPGTVGPTGNNVRWMQVITMNQVGWNAELSKGDAGLGPSLERLLRARKRDERGPDGVLRMAG